jgi:5'-nucleotidase (lipoprotein e(P4) family)
MKISIPLLVLFLIGCQPTPQETSTKEILAQQKVMATLWFQQSAEMEATYLQAYNHAKMLLTSKLDTLPEGDRYAVVLDIDETVLDNSPAEVILIQNGDTFSPENWNAWTSQARARALPGALDFVNYAMDNNVEVFYVSNRGIGELEPTLKNLQEHSFPNADSSHVLLKTETSDKTERRATVSEQAEIILFVGDNLRDYSEIFGERGADLGKGIVHSAKEDWLNNFIILPNPTYGEWEKAAYGNTYSLSDEEKLEKRLNVLED